MRSGQPSRPSLQSTQGKHEGRLINLVLDGHQVQAFSPKSTHSSTNTPFKQPRSSTKHTPAFKHSTTKQKQTNKSVNGNSPTSLLERRFDSRPTSTGREKHPVEYHLNRFDIMQLGRLNFVDSHLRESNRNLSATSSVKASLQASSSYMKTSTFSNAYSNGRSTARHPGKNPDAQASSHNVFDYDDALNGQLCPIAGKAKPSEQPTA